MIEQHNHTIQVICDLRDTTFAIEEPKQVDQLWNRIAPLLIGQKPVIGQPLRAKLGKNESVALWVVDNRQLVRITRATTFAIVDILRQPTVRYQCRACKALGNLVYGPLQCRECLNDKNLPEGFERLCSIHASFVPGRLDAYCSEHIPHCSCTPTCSYEATFYCDHCNRPFGEHHRHPHPREATGNKWYCYNCRRTLFSPCVACWREGKQESLGKLSCAYITQATKNPCDVWLCREHAQQWKIWGPHHEGITLCEEHKKRLRATSLSDVLTMMILARPPQGRYFRLTNAFRLRRILNRNRDQDLTLEEIASALQQLAPAATTWGRRAQTLYAEIKQAIARALEKQIILLKEVKAFYQKEAGNLVAEDIANLTIVDRFLTEDAHTEQIIIDLYLTSDEAGQYIGRNHNRIKQLKQHFNFIAVKLYDIRGGTPLLLE